MNARHFIVGLGALLWLGGCASSNMAGYESAMEQPATQDELAERGPGLPAAQADNINEYRVANLKPGHRPPLDSDEAGLWMTMDNAESSLRSSGHLVNDKQLNAYVKRIVCRVARQHCNDIRVYLVGMPHFNATMAPNGSMQIWTGLLLRVQNEAQLAAVIGHEVAHYLRRHSLQKMRNTIDTAGALTVFNLATLGMTGGLANLVAAGNLTAYNRDFEREADGYSLVLTARAGYDPREAPKIWQQLIRERLAEDRNVDSAFFLATHPAERERVEALQRLSKKAKQRWPKARRIGGKRYRATLRPYRARLLREELQLHRFDRAQVVLDVLKKDGHNIAELHYFQGELHRLRNKGGDHKKALAAYRKALASGKPPAELHRAMGMILLKENQQAMAHKAFRQYLRRNPKAEDAEMIRHLMKQG